MRPAIKGILETPVYVDDLQTAYAFYHDILGFDRMVEGDRIHAFAVAPGQVLIACQRGMCEVDSEIGGALVPGHRADGPSHFAFRIDMEAIEAWKAYLTGEGIAILSEAQWPLGGKSLYFNDPFGNVLEMATGDIWPNDRTA